jgi:hypothetical protein
LLELDEAKLGAQFTKAFPCQRFHRDVRQLLSGANGGDTYPAFHDALVNEAVSCIYVFADGGLTVDVDLYCAFPLAFQLRQEAHQPKVFSTGILKISVVTDQREYQIYRKFIGDRNKISEEI